MDSLLGIQSCFQSRVARLCWGQEFRPGVPPTPCTAEMHALALRGLKRSRPVGLTQEPAWWMIYLACSVCVCVCACAHACVFMFMNVCVCVHVAMSRCACVLTRISHIYSHAHHLRTCPCKYLDAQMSELNEQMLVSLPAFFLCGCIRAIVRYH